MNKISFIIPNDNKNIFNNEILNIAKLTNSINTQPIPTISKNNITSYIKIAPNVYSFITKANINT